MQTRRGLPLVGASPHGARMFAALLLLAGSAAIANAQALIPPPVPIAPRFGAPTLFAAPDFWVSVNQYPQNQAYQPFRWIYDMGGIIPIVQSPLFTLDGLSRFTFRLQPMGTDEIMLWSLDLISDIEVQAWLRLGGFDVGAQIRHNCKHDLDLFLGRLIIEDSVVLGVTHAPVSFDWGAQTSSLFGTLETVFVLPQLFPSTTGNPDRFRVDAQLHLDALRLGRSGTLFVEGGAAFTVRGTDTEVTGITPLNLDWHVRAGVHAPSAARGASLYVQLERITDPWVTLAARPVTLLSIGVTFASAPN